MRFIIFMSALFIVSAINGFNDIPDKLLTPAIFCTLAAVILDILDYHLKYK